MPKFGSSSKRRLATCDERLQKVFNEVIKHVDCSVLCGHRGEYDQNKAFEEGKSMLNGLWEGIILSLLGLLT